MVDKDIIRYSSNILSRGEFKLYLGGESSTKHADLKGSGIKYVLNVSKECTKSDGDYVYLHIPLEDSDDQKLSDYIGLCIKFINDGLESGHVLVHCSQGKSRSVAIVTAYIMHTCGLGFEKAYGYVRKQHRGANMNRGFERQLSRMTLVKT